MVGAGNDAQPLVAMAHLLGWPVTLVDGRHTHATLQRFAGVDKILVGKPDQVKNELSFDPRTAVILMTHNYNYDLDMLALLMQTKVGYIGLLGPASKRDRMVNELLEKGIVVPSDVLAKVYGPTGLNLGAETSNEIALSMVAEIMAVMTNRTPIHLKNKQAAIHQPQL